MLVSSMAANAWHVAGRVACPDSTPFVNVTLSVSGNNNCDPGVFGPVTTQTDGDGKYQVDLPDPCDGTYTVSLVASSLPADAKFVNPASGSITFTIN